MPFPWSCFIPSLWTRLVQSQMHNGAHEQRLVSCMATELMLSSWNDNEASSWLIELISYRGMCTATEPFISAWNDNEASSWLIELISYSGMCTQSSWKNIKLMIYDWLWTCFFGAMCTAAELVLIKLICNDDASSCLLHWSRFVHIMNENEASSSKQTHFIRATRPYGRRQSSWRS